MSSIPPELLHGLSAAAGPAPGGPPPSISLGGGGGGFPPEGSPAEEKTDASVVALMKQALALVKQAEAKEPDEEDTLTISKIATQIQQVIASDQKLNDDAMGATPGTKLVRKTLAGG